MYFRASQFLPLKYLGLHDLGISGKLFRRQVLSTGQYPAFSTPKVRTAALLAFPAVHSSFIEVLGLPLASRHYPFFNPTRITFLACAQPCRH
jgi:hypothetical protein